MMLRNVKRPKLVAAPLAAPLDAKPDVGAAKRPVETISHLLGPDTLQVDGCILFFCESQVWRRYRG